MGSARRSSLTLVAIIAVAVGASGCTGRFGPPPPGGCVPARMVVSPGIAGPGDVVTLSAPGVACDLNLPDPTVFELRLQHEAERGHAVEATATLANDGSFTATLVIPPDFPPGAATVFLVNHDVVDWCPGYSMPVAMIAAVEASCAGYDGALTVTR